MKKIHPYLRITSFFVLTTWLMTGIAEDDEFGEHSIFLKYLPSFQYYYTSPLLQRLYKPLHLFLVYNSDGQNEIGTLNSFDNVNNKIYNILSPYDGCALKALVSARLRYLLSFVNTDYEQITSFISIQKIIPQGNSFVYKDFIGNRNKW